jgi:hypothetical protein
VDRWPEHPAGVGVTCWMAALPPRTLHTGTLAVGERVRGALDLNEESGGLETQIYRAGAGRWPVPRLQQVRRTVGITGSSGLAEANARSAALLRNELKVRAMLVRSRSGNRG